MPARLYAFATKEKKRDHIITTCVKEVTNTSYFALLAFWRFSLKQDLKKQAEF